jgi:4-hydroxy-2-oxoheptanedioate aldolase
MPLQLKDKLKAGNNVYGTCITSTAPAWPLLASKAGLDFVFMDTEHIVLDDKELSSACHIYRALNITPIVRIPSPDPYRACEMIDAGAFGVVAPYVESVDQVREMVGAIKYRPLKGERLNKILFQNEMPPPELDKFLKDRNKDNLCIINIESVPAVERLDDLLSVEGLDAVFIGPHDLSISMNIPEQYDHPEFEAVVGKIIHKCRTYGLAVGIHLSLEAERQIRWMSEGINMVIHSSDMALFSQKLRDDMKKIKKAAGDDHTSSDNLDETI